MTQDKHGNISNCENYRLLQGSNRNQKTSIKF
jgi:hypothetical protein